MTASSDIVENENDEFYGTAKSTSVNAKDDVKSNFPLFSIDILHVIKDAQAQHGLRHGDYQRYHGYCNRRLKRIRSFLKFRMGTAKKVTPKVVSQSIFTDPRYILMLIMTSERAWSMAMHLKQEATDEARKRHHMLEKMRKAVKHANDLHNLCEKSERVDARTKLEAQAYYSYMKGVLMFELKNWVQAMDCFRQTQTIYKKLSEAMSKEEQPVYLNMVEDISPNIRYCAYTIGDDQTAMDDLLQMHVSSRQDPLLAGKLDSLIAESRGTKAASMSEITWSDHVIRVKNTKVRLFLIGVKDFEKTFSNIDDDDRDGQIDAYDGMLIECKDALQLTREDMRSEGPHSKEKSFSDLQLLFSYINYLRLIKTIRRNLLLVDALKENSPASLLPEETGMTNTNKKVSKPTEFIRLYDSIIQSLVEITNLTGVEQKLIDEISAQKIAFQAFRCFYVAQMQVNEKKWAEAMALYDRVLEHANKALQAIQIIDKSKEFDLVNITLLEELIEMIAFNRYRVHALAVLNGVRKSEEKSVKQVDPNIPLKERLDVYYEDPAISSLSVDKPNAKVPSLTSSFPPKFEPVLYKPVFFDLALNHVSFPSLEKRLAPKSGQQKAGISGLISNWWGWGGKK